jgi:nicotinate phosphoribosyltransferase
MAELPASTALLTDQYELTMVQAALGSGTADRRSVFELFARRLPTGRRYGIVAGVGRVLDAIEAFRFDPAEIDFLLSHKVVDDHTADWLAGYRFTGDVWGYPEGEAYFPGSPVLTVEGSFAEAVVLETVLLSIYNYDCAVASAASRMIQMAGDRPCIEMGTRRANEHAAVAAARAAYAVGFAATSNLEAGRRYGIPTTGTAAHSFTLLHDSEEEAFAAQIAPPCWSTPTTSRRRSAPASGSPRGGWAPSGSTPETWPSRPPRSANCSTRWAPPRPASSSPPTWTSTSSPPCAAPPWTGMGSAPRW